MITSEWGTPNQIENGLVRDVLVGSGYGHKLHVWDLRRRKHQETIDLGKEHQMVLELRPSHDPTNRFGFVGVVISLKDLSASIWLWQQEDGKWEARKVIEIPAEPADPDRLPPLLKGFKAVPSLVTDLNLSLDDKWLYVSCWAPANCLAMTSPFPTAQNWPAKFKSVGSPDARHTQANLSRRSAVVRKWSR
jgi:selenium-binding protein 1